MRAHVRRIRILAFLVVALVVAPVACIRTKSEVDVKPVAINLNITGRLELVITDARQQEEKITGSKPKRVVRPEDIGLPSPAEKSGAAGPGAMRTDESPLRRVALVREVLAAESDRQAELIRQMAARHPQIQGLLDRKVIGETHAGYLAPKGTLSAAEKSLVDAENANRAELYKLEAAKKKLPADQVALGYYLARLEHVNKGNWVERFDKATNGWEWFQWDR
ncbi:MAG: DUF1318 domain-containing protein [Candidatus Binatia bacterium]